MLNVQIALPSPNAPRTKRVKVLIDSGATRYQFDFDLSTHLALIFKPVRLK